SALDLTANIRQFDLASLQPIVGAQLRDLTGTLRGTIAVKGSLDRPDIDGGLVFAQTRFFSTYLNTAFSIEQETIAFVEEGIAFKGFEVADENDNKARLTGTILTNTYRDFRLNLD